MTVDRAWMKRNLGYDPYTVTPPPDAFANPAAASPKAISRGVLTSGRHCSLLNR